MSKISDKKSDTVKIELQVPYPVTIVGYGTIYPNEILELSEEQYKKELKNTNLFKLLES